MNVNAVVSGQAGVALLVNGMELSSIHAGRSGEIVRRGPAEARFLLGDAADLQFLENIEVDEVIRRLELASAQMDAFHTALILLDGSLPTETRQIAVEELQEFLEDETFSHFVESVLFAHPLTPDSDVAGALYVCNEQNEQTEKTRRLLQRLASFQEIIAEVHLAWERIPTSEFGTAEERRRTRSVAVKEGLFRDLVLRQAANASIDSFLIDSLLKLKVPNSREILLAWCAPLRAYPRYESEIQCVAEGSGQRYEFDGKGTSLTSPSPAWLPAEPQRWSHRATIGPAIFIKGDLTGDEDLLIEGCVEGKIDLKQNNVTVGKTGKVTADIYGQVVTVEGEVDGNVFAREAILRQSGAIRGNISASRVVLEDGSRFKGSIDMQVRDSEGSQAPGTQGRAKEQAPVAAAEARPSRIEG